MKIHILQCVIFGSVALAAYEAFVTFDSFAKLSRQLCSRHVSLQQLQM